MAQSINSLLIERVFNKMAEYKPTLNRLVLVDDDEEDYDPRMLADQIIRNVPWPMGVELRRLFSGSMREMNRGRLDQLFKTIERTMQFISFVMCVDLYENLVEGNVEIDQSFAQQFERRFFTLTLGNFSWLIRAVSQIYKKNHLSFYLPEFDELFSKEFLASLEFWAPERNDIGHYQINLTEEEIEKRCVEYSDKLTYILEHIAFLVKYRLVTIREIRVKKMRNREAQFEHWMDILNSSDSDFKSREEIMENFSDSNSVLLMKNIKRPTDFLNLSPLVIDTRMEKIDTKEKFNLKKDIFMYSKFRGGNIHYVGTEVTEKCDLTLLSNYEHLLMEFKDIIKRLTI